MTVVQTDAPPVTAPAASPSPVKPKKRRRSWKWVVFRLSCSIVFIYTSVCIMLWAMQDKLMFPASDRQGREDTLVRSRFEREIIDLKLPDGTPIKILFNATNERDSTKAPTVLFFYGNGNCLADVVGFADAWRAFGANVCIVEYPGYGMSGGKPGEEAFNQAADAAWDYLQRRPGVDGTKIIPVGWSLGAAVAIDLASRKPVAGLVTMSAFSSMTAIAQKLFPILPVKQLIRHKFDSLTKIPKVTCPALIMHSRGDTMIPWTMSQDLANACKCPVTTVWFDKYDHNDSWGEKKTVDVALRKLIDQVAGDVPMRE